MRRVFTLVLGLLVAGAGWAQMSTLQKASETKMTANLPAGEIIAQMPDEYVTVTEFNGTTPGAESGASTIWSEDFAGGFPSTWTLDDSSGVCPWKYTTQGSQGFFAGAGTPINSATSSNGFLIVDPDSANNTLFGQPSGTTYQYMASYFVTEGISTIGNPAVRLEFTQAFRFNNTPTLNVLVSNVSANGPWISYTVNNGVAANTASPDPQNISIQLPGSMGNQPNIWVKIGWRARVYFWMIDDMRIVTAPDNDLAITQEYYGNFGDSTRTAFYYAMPERQANAFNMTFGGAIINNGQASVPNTSLRVDVSNTGSYSNTSSNIVSLGALAVDSFNVSTTFSPNNGTGFYDIDFIAVSDSVDCFPDDDTVTHSLAVTNFTYARDRGTSSGGISWAAGTDVHTVAQMFEFPAADTIIGLGISFFSNPPNGTTDGGIIDIGIMDDQFTELPGGTDFYVIDQAVTPFNQYNEIIFDTPVIIDTPGEYLVFYRLLSSSDQMWISTWDFNVDDAPPLTAFVDVSNDDTWGFIGDVPELRILTRPEACQTVNILAQATVADATHPGSITINTVTGGGGGYSFSWTGPAGFPGATTQNLTNLTIPGIYTVTITDANFCSTNISYDVQGSVNVNEIDDAAYDFSVVPNPNNGEFFLNFTTPGTEVFTVEVTNMLGQQVALARINVNGSLQHNMDLKSFGKGVYFVSVVNSQDQKNTKRVIVE
ncbi:MAG: T9SS type A sorting domain-containing protein [Salibacteraceae bacterium]